MIANAPIPVPSIVEFLLKGGCDSVGVHPLSSTIRMHGALDIALVPVGFRYRDEIPVVAAVTVALESLLDTIDVGPAVPIGSLLDCLVELHT
ncbi:hypothetical protein [Halalkalicoccus salilacus]|uniref:hypothetical protein n=1 Tax=Halalkalicoccus TaxID=332246 RepID=UPI002F96B0DC